MFDRLTWNAIPDNEAHDMSAAALFEGDMSVIEHLEFAGATADLSFYSDAQLTRLTIGTAPNSHDLYVLLNREEMSIFLLDGTAGPIHQANAKCDLVINEKTVTDYLRFFCSTVRGIHGAFYLFEKPVAYDGDKESGERLNALARAPELLSSDKKGFRLRASVKFGTAVHVSEFTVDYAGNVEMVGDEEMVTDIPEGLFPTLPVLREPALIVASLEKSGSVPVKPQGGAVLRLLVDLLLEQALEGEDSRLLSHFNARFSERPTVDRFAHFVRTQAPIVAIESTLPFVEETVARLVFEHSDDTDDWPVVHGHPDGNDETRLNVTVPDGEALLQLPFHSYRGLVDAERVAHAMGTREVACLIGCDSVYDLPDSLRQVIDLTLELPRLDAALFEQLFQRVVGAQLPGDWAADGDHWVTHVHHTDFQQPLLLDLSADDALTYIRERATERLRDIEPAEGLGLQQLHGLGEARAFAEDLIADVHEAAAGRMDWKYVDRGVLLVGPPGTGKTTLARAIAKDCGIRFINASATAWQSAGHLGDHIRAIRADFVMARRFAPAILFIDEIDSIGNRETFSGQNAQYSTEVVNSLLEQIGTLDPEAPVIVMAATNYADRVDPALKRAGRLDRLIHIPRPNAKALSQIFRQYVEQYATEGADEDIDFRDLGGLSIGGTGADVELYVRGAVRRARRAGRPVNHLDLVDEITSKPRDPDSSPRLTPEELHRVAVHEAGHALAACLTSSRGRNITFVTVIPRADGALGFVASMPAEQVLMTRSEYLERLEVILGGRAAEEIVFGKENVTGGAGGPNYSSDLAAATSWARMMITQYGLSPDGSLRWSAEAAPSQMDDVDDLLRSAYDTVFGKLTDARSRLDDIVTSLIEEQELRGDDLRRAAGVAEDE